MILDESDPTSKQKGLTSQQGQKRKSQGTSKQQTVGPDPRKLRKTDYHDLLLESLPSGQYYQISYMHKDIVSHILVSPQNDTIVTGSVDGHIKFWYKVFTLIDPMRTFRAHNGPVVGMCLNKNHDLLASIGTDKMLRIFDLKGCQLKMGLKLNFVPSCCEFIPPKQGRETPMLVIGEEKSGRMMIVDYECQEETNIQADEQNMVFGQHHNNQQVHNEQTHKNNSQEHNEETHPVYIKFILNIHKHPIKYIKMNWKYNICMSIDERAFLQVWNPQTYDFPTNLGFKYKMQADFLKLIQINSAPIALSISPKGTYTAVMLKDWNIRLYNTFTGKLIHIINQSIKEITRIQQQPQDPFYPFYSLDQETFQRKITLEKDVEISKEVHYNPGLDFDESQEYLVYTSLVGVVFYSITKKAPQRVLGRKEHQRYIKCVLYQGRVMRNPAGSSTAQGQRKAPDPIVVCTSFKRPRFYIFSKRTPQFQENVPILIRDIINERTAKEEAHSHITQRPTEVAGNQVILQTTYGDIYLHLYVDDCPKTCENFIKLVQKKYYDGMIFHRVVRGFMNQTGCPNGDGTGGQSIWGGNFQDQIMSEKYRFQKPYCLAMANRGPNTNSSQFFVTVVKCPWLDGKHTIFGRVFKGIQTVLQINKIKTDKTDKPLLTVKIMSAKVV